MRRLVSLVLAGSLLSAVSGCYTWTRQPQLVTQPPAYRQYQIWTRDSVLILHKVRVEDDTLRGVPAISSRDCADCAISLPLSQVDSVRTGTTEPIGTALLGVGAGAAAILIYISYVLSQAAD